MTQLNNLYAPRTIKEFFALLAEYENVEKHFIAGGTDWLIKKRNSISEDAVLFDMSKMPELRGIEIKEASLRFGSMETMTSICSDRLIKMYAEGLSDAASRMGSVQIRNRATVGGNLANASPAADTPAALAALDASVVILSPLGERTLSVEEVLGRVHDSNSLSDMEIIKEFIIPIRKGYISAFKKVGSRSEVSIARVNMAVSVKNENGIFSDARVFVGTLGSAAIRCVQAENSLLLSHSHREESLKVALCEFAAQMIPGRSTLPYKQSALKALAEDILEMLEVRGRASEKNGEESNG